MTFASLRNEFINRLSFLYGEGEIRQFFFILIEHFSGWGRLDLQDHIRTEITQEVYVKLNNALDELERGTPVQYITGLTEFNGLRIMVRKEVLIPRPETEQLCQIIKRDYRVRETPGDFKILDICTGSGCIAIDLKRNFEHAFVEAADISMPALELTRQNSLFTGYPIGALQLDILDESQWDNLGKYHLIVSNPPYVTSREKQRMHINVLNFEPHLALFVPDDDPLIFYRRILGFSKTHLLPGGTIYFEINEKFPHQLRALASAMGFADSVILNDFREKPRFIRVNG